MQKFVNCLKFKIAPILFSVILALFLPLTSLRSEAASIASNAGIMETLFFLGGLEGPDLTVNGIPDYETSGLTQEQYTTLFGGFFDDADNYYSGLGDYLKSRVSLALSTGTLRFQRAWMQTYLEYCDSIKSGKSVGDSVPLASSSVRYEPISAGTIISFAFTRTNVDNSNTKTEEVVSFTCDYDCLPVLTYDSNNVTLYLVTLVPVSNSSCIHILSQTSNIYLTGLDVDSDTFFSIPAFQVTPNSFWNVSLFSAPGFEYGYLSGGQFSRTTLSLFTPIIQFLRSNGYYDVFVDVDGSVLTPSDTSVVSNSNSIDEDTGEITGDTVVYLPDSEVLSSIYDLLRDGSITADDVASTLGLGIVSDGLSVQDKQAIIDGLSDSVSSILTIGEAGSTTIKQATDTVSEVQTQEQTMTQEVEDKIRQGYDEDSSGKVPWWPQWSFPDFIDGSPGGLPGIDPDPDPDDTSRVTEIVNGTVVIGGLLEDFFNASGGASGFGLIYIIGVSFVLFSVLIGASHFLGALGGSDVRNSRTTQKSGQKVSSVGKAKRSNG